MTDDDDPLDGADVGETRTVRETRVLHAYLPDCYRGSDRDADVEIVDTEVVETEYGDEDVRVTFEGEVTKWLPPRWDYHAEPVTEAEQRQATRSKWLGRIGRAAMVVVPSALAFGGAFWVMDALSGSMTINGQPVTTPSPVALAFVVFGVVAITALVEFLPRRMGVHRR